MWVQVPPPAPLEHPKAPITLEKSLMSALPVLRLRALTAWAPTLTLPTLTLPVVTLPVVTLPVRALSVTAKLVLAMVAATALGSRGWAQEALPSPSVDSASPSASSPAALTVDCEIRLRGTEGRNLDSLEAGLASRSRGWFQRSRLRATLARSNLQGVVQVQSAGALGAAAPGADPMPLGLQTGYAQIQLPWLSDAWLRGGRQPMEYGAGRQVGLYDFDSVGQAFDGLRAHMARQDWLEVDVFALKLRRTPGQQDQDRALTGAYLVGRPRDSVRADLYFFYLSDRSGQEAVRLLTMGARAVAAPLAWFEAEGEVAVQSGSLGLVTAVEPQSQLSWMAAGQLQLRHGQTAPMRWTAFAHHFAGDAKPDDKIRTAWRPLYPSRDQVVGLMQLFQPSNLQQVGLRWGAEIAPGRQQLELALNGRLSRAEAGAALPGLGTAPLGGAAGWQPLGWEADATAAWKVLPHSQVLAGIAVFVPSEQLRLQRHLDTAVLALLQWTSAL